MTAAFKAFIERTRLYAKEELEARTWQYVRADLLKDESSLYDKKWWDYKPLHPLAATYQFSLAYVESFNRALLKRKDASKAAWVKPLRVNDFIHCQNAVVTGMWKARQFADELGAPYNIYCEFAMKYAAQGDWKYLPKPQMLYSTTSYKDFPSMLESIAIGWKKASEQRIWVAQSDFYKIENFCGNIHQVQHQRMLLDKLEKCRSSKLALADSWVNEQHVLSPDIVKAKFGDNFYNAVMLAAL